MEHLRVIYAHVDAEPDQSPRPCMACGACCRFATAGHRLLVSSAELALLTESPPAGPARESLRCAYQRDDLCTAGPRRPLGCRVYFCTADDAGIGLRYETHHRRIRHLHEERRLRYVYVELTAALNALLGPTPPRPTDKKASFSLTCPAVGPSIPVSGRLGVRPDRDNTETVK